MAWKPTDSNTKFGVVIFNFKADSVKCGLTLRLGELVHILEECQGWYRGFSLSKKESWGIFPSSHIMLRECRVENPGMYETVVPVTEPIVQEVTSVLREWGIIWKKIYLEQNKQMFIALKTVMVELMGYRQSILSKNITEEQQKELKNKILQKIDWGNSKLGLDLVPRIDGEIVNVHNLSVVELYKIHMQGQENTILASSTGTIRRTKSKKTTSYHLFIGLRRFMCNVGDECVISFSLYDSKSLEFISEKYLVTYSKYGMLKDPDKLDKIFAIFTDLRISDLVRDIYLVCQIIREGRLLTDSKKNPSAPVRRPFGCGAIFVGDIIRGKTETQDDEIELNVPIVCPANDDEFFSLHDAIIKKQTAKYNAVGGGPSDLFLCLRMFQGDLDKVIKEHPLVFNVAVAETKRIGFPEVIMPGDVRHDAYITVKKADFDRGSKTSQKNVQVTMNVVTSNGAIVEDSILLGTGEEAITKYNSFVIYHSNSPTWNESIKLNIPLEIFNLCHLRFTFSHTSRNEGKAKSDKIFGFSFLRLLNEDGTVVLDGTHNLFVYKADSSIDFKDVNSYLSLAISALELEEQKASGVVYAGPHRNAKETFTVETIVCSTKFSQNHDLVSLLKWRTKPDSVQEVLNEIRSVSADEIVKFLQDVFDVLFNILHEKRELLAMDVFTVLVYILCIVEENKYVKFKSTVTTYIEEHFSGKLAYRSLLNCFKQLLDDSSSHQKVLLNALKSLPLLYKFIIKSAELKNRLSRNCERDELKGLLEELFTALCDLLSAKSASLMNAKETALEKLPMILDESLNIFSHAEFSVVLCNIINCVPKKSSHLQTVKLGCIKEVVCGKLFQNQDGRGILFPLVIEHLVFHLERRQEHSLCLEILGDIISGMKYDGSKEEPDEHEVGHLASSLFTILLNVFLTIDRRGPLTGPTVSCMVGIIKLMNEKHFDQFIENFEEKGDLKDFLTKILVAFKELMSEDFFPKDWHTLRILCNNLVLTAVQYLSRAFVDHFLKDTDFEQKLWNNFFQLAVMFVTQSSLQLESFLLNKKENILDKYGDMRQIMGFEVVSMWENLEDKKIHFIPHLIGPFLQITLIPQTELRKATLPIFYDMMKEEFAQNGNFYQVERELIDKLDILVSQNKGDEEYESLFKEIMVEQVSACFDPALRETGMVCVDAVCQLLRRLLDYRAVTASYDCGMDQMMMCTVNLLNFYKQINREDMYLRYVYKLCDLHVRRSNYTEAGCTLSLHAYLLEWNDSFLPQFMKFPAQTARERKEQLYTEIIDYFDKGKTWENGIRLCKELAEEYETRMIDYSKLSKILRKQAQFYDNIMTEIRPEPGYFRVAFYGKGFPYYLKDQEYIYRGHEYEKLGNFIQNMKLEFPNAKILSKNTQPDESIVNSSGQCIQVCSVKPVASGLAMEKRRISERVKGYYKVNDVYTFTYSIPFRRGSKEQSEFLTLWLEKTTCQTREQFPGIVRWSKIDCVEKTELNPLQNAIESIASKNRELAEMILKFEGRPEENINQLSMILNGVIDANVNGGIANYQKAFLVEEYLFFHPEEEESITMLQELLCEQVCILANGLELHERLATPSIKGLHDKMVVMFESLKQSVETGKPIEECMVLTQITSLMNGSGTLTAQDSPKSRRINSSPIETTKNHTSISQIPRGFSFATLTRKVNSAISSSSPTLNRSSPPSSSGAPSPLPGSPAGVSPLVKRRSEPRLQTIDPEQAPPLPPRQSLHLQPQEFKRASTASLSPVSSIQRSPMPLSGSLPSLFEITEDLEERPPALPAKRSSMAPKSPSQIQGRRQSADSILDTDLPPLPARRSDFGSLSTSSGASSSTRGESSDFSEAWSKQRTTISTTSDVTDSSLQLTREHANNISVDTVVSQPVNPREYLDNGKRHHKVPEQSLSPVGGLSPTGVPFLPVDTTLQQPMSFQGCSDECQRSHKVPEQSLSPLESSCPRADTLLPISPLPSATSPGFPSENVQDSQRRYKMQEQPTIPQKCLSPTDATSLPGAPISTSQPASDTPMLEQTDRGKFNVRQDHSCTKSFEDSLGIVENRMKDPSLIERSDEHMKREGPHRNEFAGLARKPRPSSLPNDADASSLVPSVPKSELSKSDQNVYAKRPPKPRPRTMLVKTDGGRNTVLREIDTSTTALQRKKPPPVPPKKPNTRVSGGK